MVRRNPACQHPESDHLIEQHAAAPVPPVARHSALYMDWADQHEPLISLPEWAGGRAAIERMINCFYDRVEQDDLISRLFPGGVSAEHRDDVTTWWCEVFGGPAEYTGKLGGYPAMLAHHPNLAITADQRFRFASLMSLAADDAELPAGPEFRAALVGYLEWGTRIGDA
jgi:hemoglobin